MPYLTPRNSRNVGGQIESPMHKGLDGIWYAMIPNQKAYTVDFKFRDLLEFGEQWDDNEGKGWRIVSLARLQELITELERVIARGFEYGAKMSIYKKALSEAQSALLLEDYRTSFEAIADLMNPAGIAYVSQLWDFTAGGVESAKAKGIDVSKSERVLLTTLHLLDQGNYVSIENNLHEVLQYISDEKAKISEHYIFVSLSVSFLLLRVSTKVCSDSNDP